MAIKKINYHGTSKILLRLCEAVNSLIESGGGGGSKHTIINKNGTAMSDRAGLQFTGGATVTDDSVNDKTVVQVPDEQIQSDWNQTDNTKKDFIKNKLTMGDGIDVSAQNEISVDTAFSEASTRTNIASGDTFATILGKIKKFFTDLKTVAFSGSADDVAYDANTTIKSAVDGKVSKSGDTMTGRLNISQSNNDSPLYVKGDANGAFIGYQTVDGLTKGWIGVKSDSKPYFFDNSAKRIALLSDIPDTFGNYLVNVNKNGASKTLTVASSTRAILFTISGHPDNCALKYISSNSSGDVAVIDMINASKISVIANNNGTITVTNTEPNNNVRCAFIIINGNVTE